MIKIISKLLDLLLLPFIIPSAIVFKFVRRVGLHRLSLSKKVLLKIGVLPITSHYYDPLFLKKDLQKPLDQERNLPAIDWNVKEQLNLLNSFSYAEEFNGFSNSFVDELTFHFNNNSFCSGDAEYWYNIIRHKKPNRIIEIGSGHSTKIARKAIERNKELDNNYNCEHICIEPFEMPWLEKLGIKIIREKVENVDLSFFTTLQENDILFIDSSHIIRPQGDVLYEFLEILPSLNKGVIVHIHDIFSPRNYLEEWVFGEYKLWNEQYILEAFLTSNKNWRIIGALNYLKHNYYNELLAQCPRLTPKREPGSFYIVKN
ncbi:hypothetical protein WH52_13240 [Tenacibaculum holothuriorum]|uniref:Methyltransferase domain-containing protein n=1 Tax=Tenacibaculum holothuriorum TaxID=1635173 RepID=A0A1Y2P9A2_9FLAO|nr:class I SAM-dependent methyltransferase [Tenacibaculum holothuriorum]OSY87024.1 hypothetical protein WH52_13240 [Tenacibaculum holothuriorum]